MPPSSNSIQVLLPPPGTHKQIGYDPFKTDASSKSFFVPNDFLAKFQFQKAMVEPGIDANKQEQKNQLEVLHSYLKSRLETLTGQLEQCEGKIKEINLELGVCATRRIGLQNEINKLETERTVLIKSLSSLISREQNAVQESGDAMRAVNESLESLVMVMKTRSYLSQFILRRFHGRAEKSGQTLEGFADWAESQMLDLGAYLLRMKQAGFDAYSFADELAAANGNGVHLAAPNFSASGWAEASNPVLKTVNDQAEFISERILGIKEGVKNNSTLDSNHPRRLHAQAWLKFAQNLHIISTCILQFGEGMGKLLQNAEALNPRRAELAQPDSHDDDLRNSLVPLKKQKAGLEGEILQLKTDLSEVRDAISRMDESFAKMQKHAAERSEYSAQKAKEMSEEAALKLADKLARLTAEHAHQGSILSHTLPMLAATLWDVKKYDFCRPENKHLIYNNFESHMRSLADLYVRDGKVSFFTLSQIWTRGTMHWQDGLAPLKVIRIGFGEKNNYRMLLDISDESDPHVLFVGNKVRCEKFLEKLLKTPKAERVPEWTKGYFKTLLAPAISALDEQVRLAVEIEQLSASASA